MRSDASRLYEQSLRYNDPIMDQNKRMEELFLAFKEQSRRIHDMNDEMAQQVDAFHKKWGFCRQSSSPIVQVIGEPSLG